MLLTNSLCSFLICLLFPSHCCVYCFLKYQFSDYFFFCFVFFFFASMSVFLCFSERKLISLLFLWFACFPYVFMLSLNGSERKHLLLLLPMTIGIMSTPGLAALNTLHCAHQQHAACLYSSQVPSLCLICSIGLLSCLSFVCVLI